MKEFVNDNKVMDLLFSYVGVASSQRIAKENQLSVLNLHQNVNHLPSRATAGTVDFVPGPSHEFKVLSQRSSESKQASLAPVTQGYFYNIVRQLLAKARKQTMRYILLDTEGRLFDKLIDLIGNHSLSDLLVEIMQLNLPF